MTEPTESRDRMARLFDIRNIIAALLGIYGVALLVAAALPAVAEAGSGTPQHTPDVTDMAAGSSANLWVGIALVAVAAAFAGWALVRPARHDSSGR